MAKTFTRQIFELRFAPILAFFDHRASILDALYRDAKTKKKNFDHWQLSDNRVEVFDADRKRVYFFSFRNCGLTCVDPPTANYFHEQLNKYFAVSIDVVRDYLEEVQRAGCRQTSVIPVKDFDELKDALLRSFLKTDNSLFASLGSTISDLQLFPIIFGKGESKFQITLGPTRKEELKNLWGDDPDLPEQALYLDVDYYALQPKLRTEVVSYVSDFVSKAQDTQADIIDQLTATVLRS